MKLKLLIIAMMIFCTAQPFDCAETFQIAASLLPVYLERDQAHDDDIFDQLEIMIRSLYDRFDHLVREQIATEDDLNWANTDVDAELASD